MRKRKITILADQVKRDFLPFVRKPSRYIGGEINQVKKDLSQAELTIALCFPDLYEIGMSNTGLAIIYDVLNKIDDVVAERVFSPWLDAEEILHQKAIPLFTLESRAALKDFDIIGFSLTNELCYTNVLNILDLAGISIKSADRNESYPLIIAGGGMTNCCEPMADFIDIFLIGEGEEAVVELANLIKQQKKSSASKEQTLLKIAKAFPWAYVPRFYEFKYEDSKIKSFESKQPDLPTSFKNAVVKDFENASFPVKPIVPFLQTVHERISVEIMRGCPGRCRFCQASFCRRPVRFRSAEKITEIAKVSYLSTGFDTIGLLSLSTADYPQLEKLVSKLQQHLENKHVGISVPSLRVDQQLQLLPQLVKSVRKSGLTIAVEAANEKIRRVINKPLKDKDLFATVEAAYKAGWQKLKLYFMVGLPSEKEEDITQIVKLSFELAQLRKKIDGKTGQINITISWFVPKPHTPFAWLGQKSKSYFQKSKNLILDEKRKLNAKLLRFKFHDIERSVLESAISRGNRSLSRVIETAWRKGAKFDLWDECFNYQLWQSAFDDAGMDVEIAAQRQFENGQILPWEHLGGPDKKYLLKHLKQAEEIYSCANNSQTA